MRDFVEDSYKPAEMLIFKKALGDKPLQMPCLFQLWAGEAFLLVCSRVVAAEPDCWSSQEAEVM